MFMKNKKNVTKVFFLILDFFLEFFFKKSFLKNENFKSLAQKMAELLGQVRISDISTPRDYTVQTLELKLKVRSLDKYLELCDIYKMKYVTNIEFIC